MATADLRTVVLGLSIAGAEVVLDTLQDRLEDYDQPFEDPKTRILLDLVCDELSEQIALRKKQPKQPKPPATT